MNLNENNYTLPYMDPCFRFRVFQNNSRAELDFNKTMKNMKNVLEGNIAVDADIEDDETMLYDDSFVNNGELTLSIDKLISNAFNFENYISPEMLLRNFIEEMTENNYVQFSTINTNSIDYKNQKKKWNEILSSNKTFKGGPPKITKAVRAKLPKLNNIQQFVFDCMTKETVNGIKTPQTCYLIGAAGSGKTEVIKRIYYSYPHGQVLLTGMTGKSAVNLSCATVEGFFGIYNNTFIMNSRNRERQDEIIECLKDVKVIIIDEFGMAYSALIALIDESLKKAFNNKDLWGSCKMLLVGDNNQLPAVLKKPFWQNPLNYSNKSKKQNNLDLLGYNIYKNDIRPNTICLPPNAYRYDQELAKIVNNLKNATQTKEDYDLLFRSINLLGRTPDLTSLGIKPVSIMYDNNQRMIANAITSIDESLLNNKQIFLSIAQYSDESKAWSRFGPSHWSIMIEHCIPIYKEMQVIFVDNINVKMKISNNQTAIVKQIIFDEIYEDLVISKQHPTINNVIVELTEVDSIENPEFPNNPNWIRIFPVKASFMSKKMYGKKIIDTGYRIQFPFVPCHARTTYKIQGSEFRNLPVYVDVKADKLIRNNPSICGQICYTSFTRADSLKNLYVEHFTLETFLKMYKTDLDIQRRNEINDLEMISINNIRKFSIVEQLDEKLITKYDVNSNKGEKNIYSIRSVGIDPGIKNFSVAIWHCNEKESPILVFCEKCDLLNSVKKNMNPMQLINLLFKYMPQLKEALICNKNDDLLPTADELYISIEQFPRLSNLRWMTFSLFDGLLEYLNINYPFKSENAVLHFSSKMISVLT